MKRAVIALLLALAAVGLLISLALESRSLPVETHVAQSTIADDLQRIDSDFRALVETLQAAWRDQQPPGEGSRALLTRVKDQPQRLSQALFAMSGAGSQEARLQNAYQTLNGAVQEASTLAEQLLEDQAAYAQSVDFLRESGARVIGEMRSANLERQAADTFQLVIGTLDFAGRSASVRASELERLLVTLQRDQRVDAMPADVGRLRDSVSTILAKKPLIESRLEQLGAIPVADYAAGLTAAAEDLYTTAVARVDQARLMLAVYAIVLLVAVGFVALRLHGSYREINRANNDLAELNESLEQRVDERTRELTKTLADLKESQVQLVQAEKMSSLGQLVAGISHEINTPLLYLANNAELIRERLEPLHDFLATCNKAFAIRSEDFADRAQYQTTFVSALKDVKTMLREQELDATLEEIQDLTRDSIAGLGELTEMAQSLKDFSRLDRAPIARFDVNAGLDKTLLIAKNIVKHKANVRKQYGDIPEIECAPSQINQVFLNIITNAAQAIETQGEIVVATKMHDADHVAIAITDTGCGIPEENLAKIRDPFFTTKEVGTGTGLGLSIVDEIIRSHNGQLLVDSVVGAGSTFTVVLPVKRADAPHQAATSNEAQPLDFDLSPELAEAV
jgi:signal transduction histidine kinase